MALRSLGCASFSQDAFASGTRVALSRRLMEPMVMSFFFQTICQTCVSFTGFYQVLRYSEPRAKCVPPKRQPRITLLLFGTEFERVFDRVLPISSDEEIDCDIGGPVSSATVGGRERCNSLGDDCTAAESHVDGAIVTQSLGKHNIQNAT